MYTSPLRSQLAMLPGTKHVTLTKFEGLTTNLPSSIKQPQYRRDQ
jgi:hypothetical protein